MLDDKTRVAGVCGGGWVDCSLGMRDVTRALTRVDVGVLLHVALLVEALAAVLARVGARVAVDQQVRAQGRRALEGLAALLALQHYKRVVMEVFSLRIKRINKLLLNKSLR